jgi:hypothetical protein
MKPTLPTRRRFLGTCSTLAVTAAMGPTAALAGTAPNQRLLKEISYASFAALLHREFIVRREKQFLGALVLTEARKLTEKFPARTKSPDAGNEKFTLLFSGPHRRPLAQGTYTFEQAELGRFDMFIAPVGSGNESQLYYEATFNRPVVSDPASRAIKPY